MKKTLYIIVTSALASLFLFSSMHVMAVEATEKPKAVSKLKAAKTAKKVEPPAPEVVAPDEDDDDELADITTSSAFEYKCELGNVLTIFTNTEDLRHVALRWKKGLFRLTKIETTTGAHRFENKKTGLVWIGIPAKGMLLDSRRGQQLANECKTVEPPAGTPPPINKPN